MKFRPDGSDCNECFVKNCSCECQTCRDHVRIKRNETLSNEELYRLNMNNTVKDRNDNDRIRKDNEDSGNSKKEIS